MSLHAGEILERHEAIAVGGELGLRENEVTHIIDVLGRIPGRTELALFGGMWSEHCAYKSSRQWLGFMPRDAEGVLAGPGSHAGVVDVGDGYGVAFKIESHNHPSAVEPYQGAATGVGGILRDIIAQGARPCCVMDSLCFGDPSSAKTQHIEKGVVAGIAGYGNAFGVPNVGGQTVYDPRYEGNPLVNALAAGLVKHDDMRTANAQGVGNGVVYVGADTGRDGILGAAFASEELGDDTVSERSHVQVGDPFTGKKLMEACMSFTPQMGLVACQDMGASGITCAATEMAAAGGVGIDIDVTQIPLREPGMSPQEILLSESQERFMFVVEKGREEEALQHFRHYGVYAVVCGRITDTQRVVARAGDTLYVDLPAKLVADDSPLCDWPLASSLPSPVAYADFAPAGLLEPLRRMLASPGVADLEPLYSRYDQSVGNRTVRAPGSADAAVLKLPNSKRGFALVITGRGDACAADPHAGSCAALAEAIRRLACAGARMVAITDGLNMGSPTDPVENLRLKQTIQGLTDGLVALGIPVTGGNVSLYNESPQGSIPPTPMVGALGRVDNVGTLPKNRLHEGEILFLLGPTSEAQGHSLFGRLQTETLQGPAPEVDLEADKKLANFILAQIDAGRVRGARASALGGLSVALAKLCLRSQCGADITLPKATRLDWMFHGEHPGQAWVSVSPESADGFEQAAAAANLNIHRAGTAGGDTLRINEETITLNQLWECFSTRSGGLPP